mmetsp:Transcript_16947/g.34111  ORF Transcript_16947/g.34111 Transcript_16947/m.34111 type:complete len:587 (+) Transcript_16947:84-1844(+)
MSLAASDKDLDLFLAGVEGKLRGPFTPLELTKVLTTPALRNGLSISAYCDNLAAVFGRTDKVIQMRILLALAGLLLQNEKIADEADAIRTTIFEILHDAQTSGGQEEWVRMISGLIERILQSRDDDNDDEEKEQQDELSASSPVATMLQSACKDILESVQTLCQETTADENNSQELPEDDENVLHLTEADVDPTLAPFRYSLLKPAILDHMAPEVAAQTHFKIDTAASILQEDARLERTKAIEEAEHNNNVMGRGTKALASGGTANNKVAVPGPIMPGVQTTKKATANGKSSAKPKPKSSLFVNAKKPIPSTGGTGLRMKTSGGATSRLLGKGRTIQPNATTGAGIKPKTSLLTGIAGRAKLQNNKASKMKLMDVSEVQGLAKEKEEQASTVATVKTGLALKKGLKKRKLNDTAPSPPKPAKLAKAPLVTADRHAATAPAPPPASPPSPGPKVAPAPAPPPAQNPALAAGALAAAALSNYQKQMAAAPKPASPPRALAPPAPAAPQQLDWRSLLATKSNKLAPDDRRRIQLFFEARQNPTPAQSTYRVKLHEERVEDNGETVKWTYYLNLNYADWTSTQSKKRKKY